MPVPGLSLLGLKRIRGFVSILHYLNPTIIIIINSMGKIRLFTLFSLFVHKHILQFGYNFKVICSFQDDMFSLYIQYSISDDIVITHNFASAFKYNCSMYVNKYFQLDIHFYVINRTGIIQCLQLKFFL